ncbi:MAG TPA: VWA domain-containing protein, partial [Pyrinomonadaceae bacterium]|nr:VWA domain-containing protein [Pyrinomonadaceae bacterium]
MAVYDFVGISRLRGFPLRIFLSAAFIFFAAAGTAVITTFAQTPQRTPPPVTDDEDAPIRVPTDLVTLTLTVTDQYGRYVSGLNKNAFTVFDNNQEQEITFFSDTDAPISIGILFDVSGSMSGEKIARARTALARFINTSHPMDEYFLIAFNSRAQLLLD